MFESETVNRLGTPRRYGVKVAAATLAASASAGALWASQNPEFAHPEWWQDAAIAAALLAVTLTWMATKRATTRPSDTREPRETRRSFVRPTFDAASTQRSASVESDRTERTTEKPATEAAEKPVPPDKPEPTDSVSPLEAERARLRKAGYADSEISQILIARETSSQPAAAFGTSPMTGVLNTLHAASTHARNIIPSIKADLTQMLDRRATAAARIGAAVTLALKAAVIGVVAYVASLELSQLQSAARKEYAEACSARIKAMIDTMPMNELLSAATNDKLSKDCPH
jgi:hypothetical protein